MYMRFRVRYLIESILGKQVVLKEGFKSITMEELNRQDMKDLGKLSRLSFSLNGQMQDGLRVV